MIATWAYSSSRVFQHTAARRRLAKYYAEMRPSEVSTHSRPKAAGYLLYNHRPRILFQHTAARRRLEVELVAQRLQNGVSTHSRPKAAGAKFEAVRAWLAVSTHSRPKAAGQFFQGSWHTNIVSTHSRPKAAGRHIRRHIGMRQFQHTAARRRLARWFLPVPMPPAFQHTAARRRLVSISQFFIVSVSFNTQPPEGGWFLLFLAACTSSCFNTQPPEGGWKNTLFTVAKL